MSSGDNILALESTEVAMDPDQVTALARTERAEIDQQVATAKRYPRNIRTFKDRVVSMATIDEETAESCYYSLPRAGDNIQGPSIRLAEIVISAWGNVRMGQRPGEVTPDGQSVTGHGFCHDLENNVYVLMEAKRNIITTDGRVYNQDMITMTANAAAAVAQRNAIFKVVPRAMIRGAYSACLVVATGGAKTLTEKRLRVFEKLKKLNALITEEKILGAIGRPSIEEATLDDVAHLIGLGTAIKDKITTIDDAFPDPAAKPAPTTATATLEAFGARNAPPAAETEPAEAAGDLITAAQLAEIKASLKAAGRYFSDVRKDLYPDTKWKIDKMPAAYFDAFMAHCSPDGDPPGDLGRDDDAAFEAVRAAGQA